MNDTRQHPFEAAGFGVAPYVYKGMEEKTFQATPDAPVKAGSSCDYCANGIRYCYWLESADGVKFKVGSDCVKRIYSHLNKATAERDPVYRAMQNDRRAMEREARHEREAKQFKTLFAFLFSRQALLESIPHCYDWAAEKGLTARDEFWWMMLNGGTSGRLKTMRSLKKRLA